MKYLRTRVTSSVALAVTVALQIQWVLTWDRFALTHQVVFASALTMLLHAASNLGVKRAVTVTITVCTSAWVIEIIGVARGVPFGGYHYSESVTYQPCSARALCSDVEQSVHSIPSVAGVPIIVPLAWFAMAYAAWICSALIVRKRERRLRRWLVATVALASWDLFLDPQFLMDPKLAGNGWWVWHNPSPHLPGIPGIPVTNFLGWIVASALIQAVFNQMLQQPKAGHGIAKVTGAPVALRHTAVPAIFYVWTWSGGIFLNLTYLENKPVAVWGGVIMGCTAVPVVIAHIVQVRELVRRVRQSPQVNRMQP